MQTGLLWSSYVHTIITSLIYNVHGISDALKNSLEINVACILARSSDIKAESEETLGNLIKGIKLNSKIIKNL